MLRVCDARHFPICYDDIRTPDVRCPICELLTTNENNMRDELEHLQDHLAHKSAGEDEDYINELEEENKLLKEKLKVTAVHLTEIRSTS